MGKLGRAKVLHTTRDYPRVKISKIRHGELSGKKYIKRANMYCVWKRSLDKDLNQVMDISWESV